MRESQLLGRDRLRGLRQLNKATAEEMSHQRQRFAYLAGDESRPVVASSHNLFPTPPALARRVMELAGIVPGHSVLEPSAGTGRILDALPAGVTTTAVEIDADLCHWIESHYPAVTVTHGDFLQFTTTSKFDRIVMNPPFKMGSDIKHIRRALSLLAPRGRLVTVCANGPKQRAALMPLGRWLELPRGSFKCEGTDVETAICVIEG